MALDAEGTPRCRSPSTKAKAALLSIPLEWFKGFQEIMTKLPPPNFEARRKTIESLTQGAEGTHRHAAQGDEQVQREYRSAADDTTRHRVGPVVEKGTLHCCNVSGNLCAIRGKARRRPCRLSWQNYGGARCTGKEDFMSLSDPWPPISALRLFSDQDAFQQFLRKARDLATETKPEPET